MNELETAIAMLTKRANDMEEFEGQPDVVRGLDIAIATLKGLLK
jgi:hypothetical protein